MNRRRLMVAALLLLVLTGLVVAAVGVWMLAGPPAGLIAAGAVAVTAGLGGLQLWA